MDYRNQLWMSQILDVFLLKFEERDPFTQARLEELLMRCQGPSCAPPVNSYLGMLDPRNEDDDVAMVRMLAAGRRPDFCRQARHAQGMSMTPSKSTPVFKRHGEHWARIHAAYHDHAAIESGRSPRQTHLTRARAFLRGLNESAQEVQERIEALKALPQHDAVAEALGNIPQWSPGEIYDFLLAQGVKGQRQNPCESPLAKYLKRECPGIVLPDHVKEHRRRLRDQGGDPEEGDVAYFFVTAHEVTVIEKDARDEWPVIEDQKVITDPLSSFVELFDNGAYPDLEDVEQRPEDLSSKAERTLLTEILLVRKGITGGGRRH